MKLQPDMNWNMDTQYLTIITVFGYVLFVITFQSLVGIMTIIAATTTAFWNVYKFIMDRRDRRKSEKKKDLENTTKVIDIDKNKNQTQ